MEIHQSDLARADVLDLLAIASDMDPSSISRLLTKFCNLNSKVRFASLWRLNKRSGTISICARSESDYLPQLGKNNEYIQEFLCPVTCASVSEIIGTEEFSSGMRKDHSIRTSKRFGVFHPEDVVQEFKLDHYVVLPIEALHAPSLEKGDELPRFFCLFYCPLGVEGSEVAAIDLDLIGRCIGKMIYNQFNEKRWKKVESFTGFLSSHHNPESTEFLAQLQELVPCEAVFELTYYRGALNISCAKRNSFSIGRNGAERFWQSNLPNGASLLDASSLALFGNKQVKNVIAYQTQNHEKSNRVIILYCNKISPCPFRKTGKRTFQDDFGFDDVMLADAIGDHIHAFTLTREERKRRDDITRIIAHETKQPLIDIMNSVAKHRYIPGRFGLDMTLERITDSIELALLLADINTEPSDERNIRAMMQRSTSVIVEPELKRLKKLLRFLCDDSGFKNDNIDIQIGAGCDQIAIAQPLLATIFLNTVSNSIKYSMRDFENSWCSVVISFVSEENPIWLQNDVPRKNRRPGLLITTTDNGVGVPREKTEEVFEKEARLQHMYSVPGLGLGLYHLKRVVEALDGQVWMKSLSGAEQRLFGYSTRIFTLLPRNVVRAL